ncbi:RND superfamily putative drug exporter [Allocatelliglobosispora scoriae]|uniref:RND superfamily putative drug exporter n=1 Tax=Allocatelliglobosispora scoriae TaxID=643052 RepID=A0A841BPQ0_9ACTN|nr:MMPL family transporter [Allocatelliglobosispora scoriae]MBB5871047.1 RND superfamily putative drug exporter [Allocatelliglobosispora scoriae]
MFRFRWAVVAAWAVLAILGGIIGGQIFDRAVAVDQLSASAESMRAKARIAQVDPEGPLVIAVARDVDPHDPALVESVTAVHETLITIPGVREAKDLYTGPGGRIGADERSIMIQVELDSADPALLAEVARQLHRIRAPQVLVGGEPLAKQAFADQAVADAALGEGVALIAVAVLLIVLLRLGAVVPLAAALTSVTVTLLALTGLSGFVGVSEYTLNVVILLGLGLGLDYALLLLWRFRQERGGGASIEEALRTAVSRAGRTVLVAGGTVGVAMAGLSIFGEPLLSRMALGGAVVVVVTTLIALTLAPALIAILAPRLPTVAPAPLRFPSRFAAKRGLGGLSTGRFAAKRDGGRDSGGDGERAGVLGRLTLVAQRQPGLVAFWVTAGLVLLAVPFLGANLGNSDARSLPASAEARQLAAVVTSDYQMGRADPVSIVVESPSGGEAMRDYLNELLRLPGLLRLDLRFGVPAEGPATIVDLTPTSELAGRDLVRAVRAQPAPAPVLVGGPAAEVVDYQDSVRSNLPLVLAVLLLATGALLFAATRSLLIPLKALLLNALTLGATLGCLVVVFQWGWGEPVLGFTSWGAIDLTTPVLLFVFIFGLSTDYEVFLLSRITEEWRSRRDTDAAVLAGVLRTGPVVTTAAACLVLVFAGFALGGLIAVKEIGVGMAIAIVLDVTVVRGLLLPAVMSLLGRWNWWPTKLMAPSTSGHETITASDSPA